MAKLAPIPPKKSHSGASTSVIDSERKTILVIDDDPDARDLLEGYFKEYNAQIIFAENGSEALRKAIDKQPDLITLDIMMPGLNGWDTLKMLKECDETVDIPVVVASIVADNKKASSMGAIAVLAKPIVQSEFNDLMSEFVFKNA